jgi:hypothetical protein
MSNIVRMIGVSLALMVGLLRFGAGPVFADSPHESARAALDQKEVERVSTQAVTATQPHPKELETEILSDPFRVDRIFKSMVGPLTTARFRLLRPQKPELLWLTGYRMEIVGEDGATPESIEFECHTNLAWSPGPALAAFNRPVRRTFTLTQGQTDVRLPSGFGIPMLSTEKLQFNSQALNLNRPEIDLTVHHRARVRFVRDRDLTGPMKPLVVTAAQVMVTLEDEEHVFQVDEPDEKLAEASCHIGEFAGGGQVQNDRFGRRFTPHWVVKPGRHEYRTLVTQQLKIPYDTTVHFIGVHVHPHSVSLELHDLSENATVWKSHHENHQEQLGLASVDYFSSEEGIPLYRDHDYQLISVYDNPGDLDSDAMASMFIYYLDQDFGHGPSSEVPVAAKAGENPR